MDYGAWRDTRKGWECYPLSSGWGGRQWTRLSRIAHVLLIEGVLGNGLCRSRCSKFCALSFRSIMSRWKDPMVGSIERLLDTLHATAAAVTDITLSYR